MSDLYDTTDRVLSKPELRRAKLDRAAFAALARNPITVVLDASPASTTSAPSSGCATRSWSSGW